MPIKLNAIITQGRVQADRRHGARWLSYSSHKTANILPTLVRPRAIIWFLRLRIRQRRKHATLAV